MTVKNFTSYKIYSFRLTSDFCTNIIEFLLRIDFLKANYVLYRFPQNEN